MKIITFALLLTTIIIFGFRTSENEKLKVEFTADEWQARINWIETAKQQLRQSDLPSKTVVFIADSLLGKFQNEIVTQVVPQIPKDTATKKSKK